METIIAVLAVATSEIYSGIVLPSISFVLGVSVAVVANFLFHKVRDQQARNKLREVLRTELKRGHMSGLNLELDRHVNEWKQKAFTTQIRRYLYPTTVYDTFLRNIIELLPVKQITQCMEYYERIKYINQVKAQPSQPDMQDYLDEVRKALNYCIGTFELLGGKRSEIDTFDFIKKNLAEYSINI